MERFFGWPATYQAELWRSDDQELASRLLASAPYCYPSDEMSLEQRVLGWQALAVNVAFALLVLLSVLVFGRVWGSRRVALLACAAILLLGLWAASLFVSVSLYRWNLVALGRVDARQCRSGTPQLQEFKRRADQFLGTVQIRVSARVG